MNSKIKLLSSLFVLGLAALPFAQAADDGTIAVAPSVDAPAKDTDAPKGHDGKRMQGMLDQRLKQLDENLKLTDDQKQKIKDIWSKEAAAAKNSATKDRRAAFMAVHNEIRAVLTPEQQTKFDAMKPEGHGFRGKGKKAE
jgi:Spy/CpxP family protein refolding chaperone